MAISAVLLKIFGVSLENRVVIFWVPVKFQCTGRISGKCKMLNITKVC